MAAHMCRSGTAVARLRPRRTDSPVCKICSRSGRRNPGTHHAGTDRRVRRLPLQRMCRQGTCTGKRNQTGELRGAGVADQVLHLPPPLCAHGRAAAGHVAGPICIAYRRGEVEPAPHSLPRGQALHSVGLVRPSSLEYEPAGHGVGMDDPDGHTWPGGQMIGVSVRSLQKEPAGHCHPTGKREAMSI